MNGTTIAVRPDAADRRSGPRPPLTPPREEHRLTTQEATAEALRVLEEAVDAVALATHRALTVAQRLDEALAGLALPEGDDERARAPLPPATNRLVPPKAALSRREQEVLALVAAGHSNKAIAEALFVSPNTVKTHVASLLTKLRADSRVQLATIAIQQDLHLRAERGVSSDPVPMSRSRSRRYAGKLDSSIENHPSGFTHLVEVLPAGVRQTGQAGL